MPEKKQRQTSERWMQGTCCMQGARSRVVGELTKDVLIIAEHDVAASAACRCDICMLLLWHSCRSPSGAPHRCKLCSVLYHSCSTILSDEDRSRTERSASATPSVLSIVSDRWMDGRAAISIPNRASGKNR